MVVKVLARLIGDVALSLGGLVLLFALWQGWWSDVQANAVASQELARVQTQMQAAEPVDLGDMGSDLDGGGSPAARQEVLEPPPASFVHDRPIGVIHLPTIGEERVVKEGTEGEVLNQGVLGHYAGTAGPGQVGNFAVAGHRTTYGRPLWDLAEMRPGDPIIVETAAGYHVYRLERLEVVPPDRWQVLAPVPDDPGASATESSMVLTACHPKFSAAERLVGYAVLDRSVPRGAGPPPELGQENGSRAT